MAWWLMKSEPDVYGIQHLQAEGTTLWDGIRNYQARNFMRAMQIGDRAFFYHSNASPPGIVGLMEVIETGVVDPSQFDPASKYYDPASKPEAPRWDCARLAYRTTFPAMLSLEALRVQFSVEELVVVRRGNRLSILPVSDASAERIFTLLGVEPDA
ncbi:MULTISPECIES: EVE domain-containing protein [unclassified Cyanobium]|uniref:EVE domain-containing protein n=1 Tax=unclassified Cyanobium TaxID=2627006 RepID=UPI0020CDC92C|nr:MULTISPECIES: EVE domain-containing protein [unclassified Cyanobium]MCP9833485.1 EVE domain-containing protein [Cyanobium sp. La Preciosa 7G6]MCP9936250.1 EVE domain-containing protein [Cyanobium sp. Aljojuca 7A6]